MSTTLPATLTDIADTLAAVEAELVSMGDERTPERERDAFAAGLERAVFTPMRQAGITVPPFFASMLNRMVQSHPENAYPHFDQAFTKPSPDALAERDRRGYMERMRVLTPVALVSTLTVMSLTTAQAAAQVSHALTKAGYQWGDSDVPPMRRLINWHNEASRKTKKADKREQLERAMQIVAAEHAAICISEKQMMMQRALLVERVAARVAAW